jgi:hypothetical protein
VTKPILLRALYLGMVLAPPPAFAADLFLSPRLETQGGYENNRLQESGGGTGSACWGGSSGLEMLLIGEQAEASLVLEYGRMQYEKEDLEYKEDGLLQARVRFLRGRNDFGANAAAGFFNDEALPENDAVFQQAEPYFVHSLATMSAEWMLKGGWRRTDYANSAYTSTPDRVDTVFSFRPEWRWHVSRRTSLWAEIMAEKNLSDAPEAEYAGFGGTLGGEFSPTAGLTLGGWFAYESRVYGEEVGDEAHRETPLGLGGWVAYRIRPWLDVFTYARGESVSCTIEEDDYTAWNAGLGLRFIFEYAWQTRQSAWLYVRHRH